MTILAENKVYQKDEGKDLMNALGKKKTPFLFVIDFLAENFYIELLQKKSKPYILFDIQGKRNFKQKIIKPYKSFQWKIVPPTFESYKKSFDLVQSSLQRGDTYLLNLASRSQVNTNLSLEEIFYLSQAKYKLYVKDKFVCFSPESFVKIQNNQISSFPMKGTIDANIPNAKEKVLNNLKEKSEHYTIVDLIRNDLSQVAKKVRLKHFRYIDEIQNHQGKLLQVSSEIVGEMPKNYQNNLGDILLKLLPAGSITGAPKRKTVEIIRQAEVLPRNFYTGIFGYFDGENLDTAVMIRFIEKESNLLYFRSGGGITAMSNLAEEYEELIQKVYVPIY